ncbi:AAA family ATPase [Acidimicrobiia bacterium]|jgi:chromosome segregation protein|nr:AAA family ATPase [Acidimicrobiia bacterium]MDB3980705.1 AAA family ATPase [Acidimicrobiia bacterium]MDB4814201.1 AAA family ATPase [Acidimicrobiia bacterium]MDB4833107.1 AAA family ATPase [Acidimicrobiia bacterium]MDB4833530.1 AAA family ATPase [Acidimicrobiia bacterium]
MYLKSIVVNGFKSFAEKVNIELSNKVNVVVGPNGSGKSNVVDAISWVLGTQSPGTLRTNKMEDVIFAGTEKLAEKGFAEVYLNFVVDPEKFNGSEEISIGRKLFRDGASEYFMNGLNCRLLDIQEFLSDLGIGKQQHTIISQGQIAEILNSKPEDHRVTIEEAAGILPFKLKKDKALRRIESGDKEIKRAKDVLREINKQLKPLKIQAEQAQAHETLSKSLLENKTNINILKYKIFKEKETGISSELQTTIKDLEEVNKSTDEAKSLKTNLTSELGQGVSVSSLFKDYSNKLSTKSEQVKSVAQIATERLDNLERESIRQEKRLSDLQNKVLTNTLTINDLSNKLISKKDNLTNLNQNLEYLNVQLNENNKNQSASLEVNEAILEKDLDYLKRIISKLEVNITDRENEYQKWDKDKIVSSELLDSHSSLISKKIILKSSFSKVRKNISSIFDRELEVTRNNLDKIKLEYKNNVDILNSKVEQQESISNNSSYKDELKNQEVSLRQNLKQLEDEITSISNQLVSAAEQIKFLTNENSDLQLTIDEIHYAPDHNYKTELENIIDKSTTLISILNKSSESMLLQANVYEQKHGNKNIKITELDNQIENLNKKYLSLNEQKGNLSIKKAEYSSEKAHYYSTLINMYGVETEVIDSFISSQYSQNEIENEIRTIEQKLENIGVVNYLAKTDYEQLDTRHQEISNSIEDLTSSKKELLVHIKEIEDEIEFRIDSSFNSISLHFTEIFEQLFPGGKGSLELTNKENLLETGIEINVQPKGKKVKKLSLLSGGERSLAAIAFLFAIFKSFPSPFYILDEVEAALDDANLHRMINLLNYVKDDAQFIIVTHQQQTMHAGDILYGVTMEPGSGSRIFIKTKSEFESLIANEVNKDE